MASKENVLEEKELENVELHRTESMVNESVILEKIVNDEEESINPVQEYTRVQVRFARAILTQISAELIMFICMFSYTLRSTTSAIMIMDKICQVHLGYSEDICKNLWNYPTINNEVDKKTNIYHLGQILLQMVPSALLVFFIGSWSDKCGRKPPLMLALTGIIIDGFGTIGCAYFFRIRVEFYLISALFTGLSGGIISVLMVLYSYASDITSPGKRTLKYAFMEVAFGISMSLGQFAGSQLFKISNYNYVFTASLCGNILGLLCIIFLLEETKGLNNTDSLLKKFTDFWTLNSIVKAIVQKRPNQGREQILLLMFSMIITVIGFAATVDIMYLYVFHLFGLSIAVYETVSAVYSAVGLGLMVVIVLISTTKSIGDPVLGIAGSVALVLKNICLGLANKLPIYHLACCFGLLSSLGTVAIRARMSKVLCKDDFGKMFAFTTAAEFLLPIASTAVVIQVYNATIDVFPGLIFVLLGILSCTPIGIFLWLYRLPSVNYEEMETRRS